MKTHYSQIGNPGSVKRKSKSEVIKCCHLSVLHITLGFRRPVLHQDIFKSKTSLNMLNNRSKSQYLLILTYELNIDGRSFGQMCQSDVGLLRVVVRHFSQRVRFDDGNGGRPIAQVRLGIAEKKKKPLRHTTKSFKCSKWPKHFQKHLLE